MNDLDIFGRPIKLHTSTDPIRQILTDWADSIVSLDQPDADLSEADELEGEATAALVCEFVELVPECLGNAPDSFYADLELAWVDSDHAEMGRMIDDLISDYAQRVIKARQGEY